MTASIRIGFASCVALMLFLSASVSRASYVTTHLEFPSPKYMGANSVEFPTAGGGVVRVGRNNDFFDVFLEPPYSSLAMFPPAGAPPQINSFFDIFTEFDLTPPGGMPTSRHGITQMTTSAVRLNGLPPGEPVFNTEMLQLNISGGTMPPAVMIRESPTKASLGKTSVSDLGGGLYRIDSFFDVFTELSLDGGQTWTPSNSAMRLVGVGVPEPSAAMLLLVSCTAIVRCRTKRR